MKVLFLSSCGMALGSAYCLVYSESPLKLIWTSGVLTSLLNHSVSDETSFHKKYFRCLDRNAMRCGFVLYTLYRVKYLHLLYLSASFYVLSKMTKVVYFHVVCHFFVAAFHHFMLLA